MALYAAPSFMAAASPPTRRRQRRRDDDGGGKGYTYQSLFWRNLAPPSTRARKPTASSRRTRSETRSTRPGAPSTPSRCSMPPPWSSRNPARAGFVLDSSNRRLEVTTTSHREPLMAHIPTIDVDI